MDPATVDSRREALQLIDVRNDEEWAAGHLSGSVHIPMEEVAARLGEVDRDRTVVTVCRSGRRSGQVARELRDAGFEARNLEGGLERWVDEGLPLTSAGGDPGRVG